MMKKKKILASRAVMAVAIASQLAAALTACTDWQEAQPTADLGGQPIVLTVGTADQQDAGGTTRISIGSGHGSTGTVLYAGEQMGVHFTSGSTVESAVYTVTSATSGTTPATMQAQVDNPKGNRQPYFQAGATSATMRAYFPAVVPMKSSTWTVRTDQDTDDGFRKSDLMYGEATVNATTSALTLTHRMARIDIAIDNGGLSQEGVDIIGGAYRTVNISDPATLTPGTTLTDPVSDDDGKRIVVYSITANNSTWEATCLLPPQVIGRRTDAAPGDPVAFMRINYQGGPVTFTIDPSRIEAGKTYKIQINTQSWMLGKTLHLGAFGDNGTITYRGSTDYAGTSPGLYEVNGVTFQMKPVKGGSYTQVRNNTTINGRLSDYWIAETETTQGLYKAVMGHLPYASGTTERVQTFTGDNYPCGWLVPKVAYGLDGVNGSFIDALNTATAAKRPAGYVFDIASEAEWEYAAKGGIYTHGYTYAGTSTSPDDYIVGAGESNYARVASKLPNELGLFDMTGNMWEDCRDRFPENFYSTTQTVTAADDYYPWVEDADAVANATLQTPAIGGCFGSDNPLPMHHNTGTNWKFNFVLSPLNGINEFNTIRLVLRPVQQRFTYTGSVQTFTAPATGYYRIECWGAQGGTAAITYGTNANSGAKNPGGKGGYASVYRNVTAGTSLFVYVGECGDGHTTTGTWNGGGRPATYNGAAGGGGGLAGGGATDVRTANGAWDNASSLASRIIVAGGGGGATGWNFNGSGGVGGYGGGDTGGPGQQSNQSTDRAAYYSIAQGGSQSGGGSGGKHITSGESYEGGGAGYDGALGKGGDGADEITLWGNATNAWGSGGGGGYYGGGGAAWTHNSIGTGAGGSSYVNDSGNATNRRVNIAGNAQMPSPTGLVETGHTGHGYVRITYAGTTAP